MQFLCICVLIVFVLLLYNPNKRFNCCWTATGALYAPVVDTSTLGDNDGGGEELHQLNVLRELQHV